MYLYFNFLITWVNNYGIIARQVWLHFENWSPTGWICYVLIAAMCARIRPWGSPFSAILRGVIVSTKSLVYFLRGAGGWGSCPWLCDLLDPAGAVIRVLPLRAMVFICFHVFPAHHLWAPWGPEQSYLCSIHSHDLRAGHIVGQGIHIATWLLSTCIRWPAQS